VEEYEERLSNDCIARPNHYFQRRTIPILRQELLDYAYELRDLARDIGATYKNGRHYKSSGACMTWGTPCTFLGICSGHDNPDSDRWKKNKFVHHELDMIEGDGRSVLTYSRIQTYKLCKKKEHFKYGIGIERADDKKKARHWSSGHYSMRPKKRGGAITRERKNNENSREGCAR